MGPKISVRTFKKESLFFSYLAYLLLFTWNSRREESSTAGQNPAAGALQMLCSVCAQGIGEMLVLMLLSLFRVDMSKPASWQPSKSWTLLRWVEKHSAWLVMWVKFNSKRWHAVYLRFMWKGMVLASERLLSVCRAWPLESVCPLWDFCVLVCRGLWPFTNCRGCSQEHV